MHTTNRNNLQRTTLALVAAAVTPFFLQSAAAASGLAGKTDTDLARTLSNPTHTGWSSVIAELQGPLTSAREAELTHLGAHISRRLPLIGAVAVRVPNRSLKQMVALPFVAHLSSDGSVAKCDEFTVGSSGAGAAYEQYGLTGEGVAVAVLDSGISSSLDFTELGDLSLSRVRTAPSFVPGDPSPADACGHGTHVAGIIGGNGSSSNILCYHTFYGIAREADIVNVRVLDAQGGGTVSSVIAGIQWVLSYNQNPAITPKIKVMNLSLGHPVGESYTTDPLCQAVEKAWTSGIVVVCAAGNMGRINDANTPGAANEGWGANYGSIQSPGNDPSVITVGATKSMDGSRADDRIATYSSRGPSRLDLVLKPDILAPGNKVISLEAFNSTLYKANSGTNQLPWQAYSALPLPGSSLSYFVLSGTSMAAPVISGAAALLLQKYPKLSPDTIKARLMISADKWADPNGAADICTYGAGYVNIPAALKSKVVATHPASSPTMTQDNKGNVSLNSSRVVWGTSGYWGTGVTDSRVVWGTSAFQGNNGQVSDSRVVWGTSVWGDRVVWGTNTSAVDLSDVVIHGE